MSKFIQAFLIALLIGTVTMLTSSQETIHTFSPADFEKKVTKSVVIFGLLKIPCKTKTSSSTPALKRFYSEHDGLAKMLDETCDIKKINKSVFKLEILSGISALSQFDADVSRYYYLAGRDELVKKELIDICGKLGKDKTYKISDANRDFEKYVASNMERLTK